jgi:import inner membrane translocase subunit TIM54
MSSPPDASATPITPSSSKTPTPGASQSAAAAAASTTAPGPPKSKSGIRAALEYTGIPPSLFEKRPKLPSRNWLIFWSVVGTTVGYYVYDRRESKRIRAEYVARVAPLADAPLHSLDLPRKVTVYGAKWPGDEDYDRNIKYFRKYVKVRAWFFPASS